MRPKSSTKKSTLSKDFPPETMTTGRSTGKSCKKKSSLERDRRREETGKSRPFDETESHIQESAPLRHIMWFKRKKGTEKNKEIWEKVANKGGNSSILLVFK